jgi:Zn-dependent protease with chaperone function
LLAFSDRLLADLDDVELRAVTVHELAHLGESRPVRVARAMSSMMLLGLALIKPLLSYGAWACAPLVPTLLFYVVYGKISRRMEVRSDQIARAHETSAGSYAWALEKNHIANLTPAVNQSKNSSHPHLYDRMLAAGVAPNFERPAPPRQKSIIPGIPAIMVFVICAVVMVVSTALRWRAQCVDAPSYDSLPP